MLYWGSVLWNYLKFELTEKYRTLFVGFPHFQSIPFPLFCFILSRQKEAIHSSLFWQFVNGEFCQETNGIAWCCPFSKVLIQIYTFQTATRAGLDESRDSWTCFAKKKLLRDTYEIHRWSSAQMLLWLILPVLLSVALGCRTERTCLHSCDRKSACSFPNVIFRADYSQFLRQKARFLPRNVPNRPWWMFARICD